MRNALVTTDFAWGYVGGVSLSLPVFDHGQGEAARAHAQPAAGSCSSWVGTGPWADAGLRIPTKVLASVDAGSLGCRLISEALAWRRPRVLRWSARRRPASSARGRPGREGRFR
jgi:hypothetical protein